MHINRKEAILVFLKYPENGRVKTRLAKDIGTEAAVTIYNYMVEDLAAMLKQSEYTIFYYLDSGEPISQFENWLGKNHYSYQYGDDLGKRLSLAFSEVWLQGFEKVIVLGGDCPFIDHVLLKKAFTNIDKATCVIGPAYDGGYYLIGFHKDHYQQDIFKSIHWSTANVLKETIMNMNHLSLKYFLLEKKHDIDTKEDLKIWFDSGICHDKIRQLVYFCLKI